MIHYCTVSVNCVDVAVIQIKPTRAVDLARLRIVKRTMLLKRQTRHAAHAVVLCRVSNLAGTSRDPQTGKWSLKSWKNRSPGSKIRQG